MPSRLALALSASFGTACVDLQSSVGHQRTVSGFFFFTRWRLLQIRTLMIIAVADATFIFAKKNGVVTTAHSTL